MTKIKTSRTSPKHDNNEFSSFTSNGEGVVSIKLDVMLDHFGTGELIKELIIRSNYNFIEENQKIDLCEAIEIPLELNDYFEENNDAINKMSMKDHLKFEHLMKVFNKYSLEEIESKLPL